MMLYHGTNGAWLDRIMQVGLRPRGTKGRSNWKDTVQSNPKCVYFTDSYAPYFAFNASRGTDPSCAVIEVDSDRLDQDELFPDEDFLEQCSRGGEGAYPGTMIQRTLHYRRRQFEFCYPCTDPSSEAPTTWWEASLKHLGTCSHRGPVPPDAITRAVWWPRKDNGSMVMMWDPTITLMNQRIMGDRYKIMTRKLFDGAFSTLEEFKARYEARRNDPKGDFELHNTDPLIPVIENWRLIDHRPHYERAGQPPASEEATLMK